MRAFTYYVLACLLTQLTLIPTFVTYRPDCMCVLMTTDLMTPIVGDWVVVLLKACQPIFTFPRAMPVESVWIYVWRLAQMQLPVTVHVQYRATELEIKAFCWQSCPKWHQQRNKCWNNSFSDVLSSWLYATLQLFLVEGTKLLTKWCTVGDIMVNTVTVTFLWGASLETEST